MLGRPRHSGEKNIEMVFKETGWEDVHWIQLVEDDDKWQAVAKTVLQL